MTDENMGEGSVTATPIDSGASESVSPAPSQPTEKVFTQTQVNDIVSGRLREERNRAQAQASAPPPIPPTAPPAQPITQPPQVSDPVQMQPDAQSQTGQAPGQDVQDIVQKTWAELQKKQAEEYKQYELQQHYQKVTSELDGKLGTAKEKYPDFVDKVQQSGVGSLLQQDLTWQAFLNQVDNAGDVTYHLADNVQKIAILEQLHARNPQMAIHELQKLSQSLKNNEAAKNQSLPSDPLGHVKASHVSSNDKGDEASMSVSDFRNQSWLRG